VATIYIDGKPYEVNPKKNLLEECLSKGLNLPYFCWHPAMGSVGACRQCAVKQYKDENDKSGKIVMACMTPASDGTRISINDPQAVEFRASVIEWMMVNHPHDCPICDEGGECHLQDMTVMTGHDYRNYPGNKRTYNNQYLGPLVNQEMNRCIQCYRCVRFYREYAGGRDFDSFASRNRVFYGRYQEGVLENEFSGNLVEVCPTGVFTDKTLKKHYTRKWDLSTAPSVCVNCSLGCNTIPGERYGGLRRIRNRYNRQVNGYFLCDRGRYGYEFVNSEQRIRHPLVRQEGATGPQAVSSHEVSLKAANFLGNGAKVIGIGSPRASLEANFALRKLVGQERFFAGVTQTDLKLVSTAIKILQNSPAPSASLHDVELADAAFVLGEDLTNTAPMLALALRQTVRRKPMETAKKLNIPMWDDHALREIVQDELGPLYIATPTATKLDDVATQTYLAAPDDLARLGFAVAHYLNESSPEVPELPEELMSLAEEIAEALKTAEKPVVISGTSCGNEALLYAAANIAWALQAAGRPAELCFTAPESNSIGLGLMTERSMLDTLGMLKSGEADTLVVLENDLYRRAESTFVDELMAAAKMVVAIDHLENQTTLKADIVLPAATFAEGDGTFVNNEGRAQRFYQVFVPEGEIRESWSWLFELIVASGRAEAEDWMNLDDVIEALAGEIIIFSDLPKLAPSADFRITGMKVPRQPHRYSGRTAMRANIAVSEPKPPDDPDTPLAFSMEGFKGKPPAPLVNRYWSGGWNSVQALNKFQIEVAGPLRGGDPGLRLIGTSEKGKVEFYRQIPQAFKPRSEEWMAVPIYHIFGSEELSVLSPGISELVPEPYIGIGTGDAETLSVAPGDSLELSLNGASYRLPVRVIPSLPQGVLGLPVGLHGVPGYSLPAWMNVKAGEENPEEA
jgi:NADH-quinone oxidoreductase subunit G